MEVVLDLEGNNLLPQVDKIFCVCVLETATRKITTYTEPEAFKEAAKEWTTIIGHGILAYDFWTIWKVWGIPFSCGPDTLNGNSVKWVCTLTWARYLWPDRPYGHGLSGFGDHMGFKKTEFDDFSEYSEVMEAYCINDVLLTEKVYRHLLKEINDTL